MVASMPRIVWGRKETLMTLSRWLAPAALAVALGFGAMAPASAQAQDLTRVLVDIADVVMRGDTPYYRNSNYGYEDRLIVQRDRYGRPAYYRAVPQYQGNYQGDYRGNPPYGNAYGYDNNRNSRTVKCNKHGKCKASYYDPRHDRDYRDDRDDDRYSRHDRRDRYWDGRRWRDRDDD